MSRTAKMTGATAEQVGEAIESTLPKFPKERLLKSRKYAHRRDALNILLKDGESYSHMEVDKLLKEFYEGGNK